MPENLASLTPQTAWQPLPTHLWNEAAARHLLQRIGFGAPPAETARVLKEGPAATLQRYFARMPDLAQPRLIADLEAEGPEIIRNLAKGRPEEKRLAQQAARERSREALLDLTIKWLAQAAQPTTAPAEKWLLFLSDVWVVSIEKVKNAALIYQHQDWLRRAALGPAPALAKLMSRSPAMIVYLDLQNSKRDAPNENFARELFELFTLGEGHYSENDIKQAARTFTGYRRRNTEFHFDRRQHDEGEKTIFGQTGRYSGDDTIDLVFRQPAARSFLPREMTRFYLSDQPLPDDFTSALGTTWAQTGYDLRQLALTFFGSRLFFAEEYRGNLIKSPIQFYLGLMQDLGLSVAPLQRQVIGALRQMGQLPFDPPNVRGWVGGRSWINSATLAARRQLIEALLRPLNPDALNADEIFELDVAAINGTTNFSLTEAQLATWGRLPAPEAAAQLLALSLPAARGTEIEQQITAFLARGSARPAATARAALATLLESPAYQLC